MLSVEGKKDSVQWDMLEPSATMRVSVEKVTQSTSLAPKPLTQNDGKNLRTGTLPEAVVPLERGIKDRAEITLVETVRTRHVIFGTSPNVNITKHIRDANSVKRRYSGAKRLTVSLRRSRTKLVVKVLLHCWRTPSNQGVQF